MKKICWSDCIDLYGDLIKQKIQEVYPQMSFVSRKSTKYKGDVVNDDTTNYTIIEGKGMWGRLFGKKLVRINYNDHFFAGTRCGVQVFDNRLTEIINKALEEMNKKLGFNLKIGYI